MVGAPLHLCNLVSEMCQGVHIALKYVDHALSSVKTPQGTLQCIKICSSSFEYVERCPKGETKMSSKSLFITKGFTPSLLHYLEKNAFKNAKKPCIFRG